LESETKIVIHGLASCGGTSDSQAENGTNRTEKQVRKAILEVTDRREVNKWEQEETLGDRLNKLYPDTAGLLELVKVCREKGKDKYLPCQKNPKDKAHRYHLSSKILSG
jgi:hypothetical protein